MLTYNEIIKNETIKTYIIKADESLAALGYTEHSFAHVMHVSQMAGYILETLGYDAHSVELAKIAGYLHDIGNLVNRKDHSQSGAIMAYSILNDMGCSAEDVATIVTAIGNHDEGSGVPVNAVAAAMILADKADVRRSRVRNQDKSTFDIHDRVNYSVKESKLKINQDVLNAEALSDLCGHKLRIFQTIAVADKDNVVLKTFHLLAHIVHQLKQCLLSAADIAY